MNREDIHHTTGYSVPKDYFKTFEERLSANISENRRQHLSGFKVPTDYFKHIEDSVLERVQFVKPLENKKAFAYWKIAAIAAAIVIAVSVVNYQATKTLGFDDLKMVNIENYFEDIYVDLDDDDLHALLEDDTYYSLNLDSDALFEYLDNRIEDPTLLIE